MGEGINPSGSIILGMCDDRVFSRIAPHGEKAAGNAFWVQETRIRLPVPSYLVGTINPSGQSIPVKCEPLWWNFVILFQDLGSLLGAPVPKITGQNMPSAMAQFDSFSAR